MTNTKAAHTAKLGDTRVSLPGDYGVEFYIEEFTCANHDQTPGWYAVSWEERGRCNWAGPFQSFEAAREARAND